MDPLRSFFRSLSLFKFATCFRDVARVKSSSTRPLRQATCLLFDSVLLFAKCEEHYHALGFMPRSRLEKEVRLSLMYARLRSDLDTLQRDAVACCALPGITEAVVISLCDTIRFMMSIREELLVVYHLLGNLAKQQGISLPDQVPLEQALLQLEATTSRFLSPRPSSTPSTPYTTPPHSASVSLSSSPTDGDNHFMISKDINNYVSSDAYSSQHQSQEQEQQPKEHHQQQAYHEGVVTVVMPFVLCPVNQLDVFADVANNTKLELDLLRKLLGSQLALSNHRYKESVCLVYQARWLLLQSKWPYISGTTQLDEADITLLTRWLMRFFKFLLGKTTLYYRTLVMRREEEIFRNSKDSLFHSSLSGTYYSSSNNTNMRLDGVDFYGMMEAFVAESKCSNVSLVLHCNYSDDVLYEPNGYEFRMTDDENDTASDRPSGLKAWPAIVSAPGDPPLLLHWPNVISLIMDYAGQPKRNYYHEYDQKMRCTYFIAQVEPSLHCVIIFNEQRRKEKDPSVLDFLQHFVDGLRLRMLLSSLFQR
eukprot:TRINITY_DN7582_c0_g1_i1.p1 TRINITY_DN7582_c0_g1~~TRINITY_DN7582_c0_g1_i1.p1  ORF type:complete len:535 (-),score=103.24 TRINITY_DN7582_c0_g1_i1:47-1651(-)